MHAVVHFSKILPNGRFARSSNYQRPLGLCPPFLTARVISEEWVAATRIEVRPSDLRVTLAWLVNNFPSPQQSALPAQTMKSLPDRSAPIRRAGSKHTEWPPELRPARSLYQSKPVALT